MVQAEITRSARLLAGNDLLARYQQWRPIAEPLFWVVLFAVLAASNSWLVWIDLGRDGNTIPLWQPAVWECSSHLIVLALLPAIVAFERRFPLRLMLLRRNLPIHLLATLAFSVLHIAGMVALRKLAYLSQNEHYVFGTRWQEMGYEYLKDLRTYFTLLLTVGFYRLWMLRWQGEASLLAAPDDGPPVESVERPERFLVQKLGKEFLLPAAEIEWIQAWGNYVNLRVRAHDYPLRATMTAIEQRLDPRRFVRVHRSYIVNLDFLVEIEPLDSGDARAKLRDGSVVPVSRRYRGELRKITMAA
jgi:DNA-binding LytR/AlgR family response regulator